MKVTLICNDTERTNGAKTVFTKPFDDEIKAHIAAKRDFKLRCRQMGSDDVLAPLKEWSNGVGSIKVAIGLTYEYIIQPR